MRPYYGCAHFDESALTWLQCEIGWYIILLALMEEAHARNAIRTQCVGRE